MMVRSNTVSLTVVSTSSTQLSDMTKSSSVIRNERYICKNDDVKKERNSQCLKLVR